MATWLFSTAILFQSGEREENNLLPLVVAMLVLAFLALSFTVLTMRHGTVTLQDPTRHVRFAPISLGSIFRLREVLQAYPDFTFPARDTGGRNMLPRRLFGLLGVRRHGWNAVPASGLFFLRRGFRWRKIDRGGWRFLRCASSWVDAVAAVAAGIDGAFQVISSQAPVFIFMSNRETCSSLKAKFVWSTE